jgi:hypothetical protein
MQPQDKNESKPLTTALEAINSLQGLIIISMSIALFACIPLVTKEIKPDWASYCQILLSIGATAINSGDRKQVVQKGKFEKIEGAIVNQRHEETTEVEKPPTESEY